MEREGIPEIESLGQDVGGTVVYVAVDGVYAGHIELADVIKEDSKEAIEQLKKIGVHNTIMLTGDNESTATAVGNRLGIDKVYASLLPHEKLKSLKR